MLRISSLVLLRKNSFIGSYKKKLRQHRAFHCCVVFYYFEKMCINSASEQEAEANMYSLTCFFNGNAAVCPLFLLICFVSEFLLYILNLWILVFFVYVNPVIFE